MTYSEKFTAAGGKFQHHRAMSGPDRVTIVIPVGWPDTDAETIARIRVGSWANTPVGVSVVEGRGKANV